MQDLDLRERLAVLETQLVILTSEVERMRVRLHELESDRATLKIVVEQMQRMNDQMEKIVDEAARRAVDLAIEAREDLGRKRVGMKVQLIGIGIGVGGFLITVVYFIVYLANGPPG